MHSKLALSNQDVGKLGIVLHTRRPCNSKLQIEISDPLSTCKSPSVLSSDFFQSVVLGFAFIPCGEGTMSAWAPFLASILQTGITPIAYEYTEKLQGQSVWDYGDCGCGGDGSLSPSFDRCVSQ